MKNIYSFSLMMFMFSITVSAFSSNIYINENTIGNTVNALKSKSSLSEMVITRGVTQAAALWTENDGSQQDFDKFCKENFCKNIDEKTALFYRICDNFEVIMGYNNRISIELQRPEQVSGYESTLADQMFSAYDGMSHFQEDMFANKLAFVVVLNFPSYTLKEKVNNGARWSDLEWGFVRLGDVFDSRVPAEVQQKIAQASAAANHYIDNYYIDMEQVGSFYTERFWNFSTPLISHWGLRDELKAAYADKNQGLSKQIVLYDVMQRVIEQTVPADIVKHDKNYVWYPSTNQVMLNGIEILSEEKVKDNRYQYLLNFFRAEKAADSYYKNFSNFIERKFNGEYEIAVEDVEKLFADVLSSPTTQQVGNLISKRLGRKLYPFDIWYDGFKDRSNVNQSHLDSLVQAKYPNLEAFKNDLPHILSTLGFEQSKIDLVCNHVTVDPSVGAGHAWESMRKGDNSMLRTHFQKDGMDYKGYNIGVHEFGHNVEQTISLYDVPNYFLRGVPNTAFTEALAFSFQAKDLELLGINSNDKNKESLKTLDMYWNCCESMGVALVDIKIWQWMYAHPNANADELKNAVMTIAKEVWNLYFEPVFKVKDQTILAVYSHIIVDPLYLSAYPIGYLVQFQLESYLKDKTLGPEIARIFKQGKLTPDLWMQRAVGQGLSAQPLLDKTNEALQSISQKPSKGKNK